MFCERFNHDRAEMLSSQRHRQEANDDGKED